MAWVCIRYIPENRLPARSTYGSTAIGRIIRYLRFIEPASLTCALVISLLRRPNVVFSRSSAARAVVPPSSISSLPPRPHELTFGGSDLNLLTYQIPLPGRVPLKEISTNSPMVSQPANPSSQSADTRIPIIDGAPISYHHALIGRPLEDRYASWGGGRDSAGPGDSTAHCLATTREKAMKLIGEAQASKPAASNLKREGWAITQCPARPCREQQTGSLRASRVRPRLWIPASFNSRPVRHFPGKSPMTLQVAWQCRGKGSYSALLQRGEGPHEEPDHGTAVIDSVAAWNWG
ncbi:hypothetical protein BU16DRAFT_184682 [Lophium mytilinum]|uniref:Uncharacterized protein n=1 Tax=Lophium mytilinum TaxID=390894 RepID=A0A6A6QBX0_9PEZI|nr:hypothetical protein BU16DRAFT_184682 [Lophium mytilinum]